MNNEDHFKNKSDQTLATSKRAGIVNRPGHTPPKKLNRSESVDRSAQSHPVSQNRPRLSVIGPSLVPVTSESPVAPEVTTETPPVIKTIFEPITEASEATDESNFESTEADGTGLPSDSLPYETTYRWSVAILALLVTNLFVGCFLGSMWWYGSTPEIVDSPVTSASEEGFFKLKGISQSPDEARQVAVEISPDVGEDTGRFSQDEALVDQSMDEGTSVETVAALTNVVDQKEWNNNLESDSNDSLDSNLVDAKRNLESAVRATDDGMFELGDERDLKQKSVAGDGFEDPLLDSIDWNLALQFSRNGVGSATLNGEPIKAIFLKDNAVFLLRKIAGEFRRRVRFLENRLGSKVSGSIAIRKDKYSFGDLSELDKTIDEIEEHISKLNVHEFSVSDLMKVRDGYREQMFAERKKLESINLARANLRFYTEDEAFTISSVVSATEGILRELAKERLERAKDDNLLITKTKQKNLIEPRSFKRFANGGALTLPNPKFTDQSVSGIQKLGPSELQRILQDAPSVDLFRSDDEFLQAKEFVYSNGPPEMQIQLAIDKINGKLNDGSIVLTEAVRDSLSARRARMVRDLRAAINKGGQNRVLAAMEAAKRNTQRVRDSLKTGIAPDLAMAGEGQLGDAGLMEPLKDVLAKRTDLQGLPFVMGEEGRSDPQETSELSQVSFTVGRTIARFNGSLGSRDAAQNDAYRNLSIKKKVAQCMKNQADNPSSQKLKTIDQILQIDHPRLRLEMIEALRKSGSKAAVKVMANKAKFDLEPEVRMAATDALAEADPEEVRRLLLEGLKYPWHVVAEHSAEALVRLDDQDAVGQLVEMLDLPHPHAPFNDNGKMVQHELVGINHLRNCLLCHAPSMSTRDSVKGLVPHTSSPLPPTYYGRSLTGAGVPYSVRADVTYLEQDFSVVQPIKAPGPWPSEQRIDYVVQKRKLKPAEVIKVERQIGKLPNLNRNAIVFALQELTGEKPANNSSGNWKMITAGRDQDGS